MTADANFYYNRAIDKTAQQDWKGAIEDYDEVILLSPRDADAFYNRGCIKMNIGDIDGALADINHAINLNPQDTEYYYTRGKIRSDTIADYEGALADLQMCLKLGSPNPQLINQIILNVKKSIAEQKTKGREIFCLFFIKGAESFAKPIPHAMIFDATYYNPDNIEFRRSQQIFALSGLENLLESSGIYYHFYSRDDKYHSYIFLENYEDIPPKIVVQKLHQYIRNIFRK